MTFETNHGNYGIFRVFRINEPRHVSAWIRHINGVGHRSEIRKIEMADEKWILDFKPSTIFTHLYDDKSLLVVRETSTGDLRWNLGKDLHDESGPSGLIVWVAADREFVADLSSMASYDLIRVRRVIEDSFPQLRLV